MVGKDVLPLLNLRHFKDPALRKTHAPLPRFPFLLLLPFLILPLTPFLRFSCVLATAMCRTCTVDAATLTDLRGTVKRFISVVDLVLKTDVRFFEFTVT